MEARNTENHTSELEALLAGMSTDQIRFVVARQHFATDKEAAEEVGLEPNSVYHWPNKEQINEAVRLMAYDGLIAAKHIRHRNLAKAMSVKVAGLDTEDERLRQNVATEIIEWEMGRATQRREVSGDSQGFIVRLKWDDSDADEMLQDVR
jgi:hypothetical protein